MNGKRVIVTGANSGIGKIAARELAQMGASVVMVCRSEQRGKAALDEIKAAVPAAEIELMLCDLSSQASIREFAGAFQSKYDRLDVLLNNAGAMFTERKESVDGIELTFALNHLGYYLLTLELIDLLKASGPARIVNVSSDAHRNAKQFAFEDYQRTNSYSRMGFQEYSESKLANILFTKELARRLEGSDITVNALHPGFVRTQFASNNGMMAKVGMAVLGRLFAVSPEKGAETSVYLASSAEVDGITGNYYADSKESKPNQAARDEENQRRLWELSTALTGATLD